jgi:hypothetical protein
MKTTTYMVLVFASVLLICVVALQMPSPLTDFTAEDCVWWLEWDKDIHESYLSLPEGDTGTYKSHQQWISDFTQIIARIKKEPSKLTKDECIQLLYKAQSTHAGDSATDYNTVNWNSKWFFAYENIIKYMKSQ